MSERKQTEHREPLIHLTKRVGMPFWQAWLIRIAAVVLGLIVCGAIAFLLMEKLQKDPAKIKDFYFSFIKGSFLNVNRRTKLVTFSDTKMWTFLKDTSILLCISLALTPAFRMRFWNIGGEGQTLMGVLGAIAVNFYLGGKIEEWLLLVLMFLAAIVSGALWGVIPALFRARWGTNETLFTLMMNYVATSLVAYFLLIWVPSGSSSLAKMKTGKLPSFGSDYLVICLSVLLLAVGLYIYLNYSKHGYEISVVGESVRTAQYVGIGVGKVIARTMVLSGALCGFAGYLIGAGLDQTITVNSAGGNGFTAIMVTWLAKFNPLFMLLTGALITLLNHGASQISEDFNVSGAFPDVIVGIILFFIIGSEFFINYRIHFRRHSAGKEMAE